MVGFFLRRISVMLWNLLLVLVCFTTVLTTRYTCLPQLARWFAAGSSCDVRHLCITVRLCVWPLTKQPILISTLLISFEVSKYLSCLQPAASHSILFTPMRVCLTPKVLINLERCLICPWISPDYRLLGP